MNKFLYAAGFLLLFICLPLGMVFLLILLFIPEKHYHYDNKKIIPIESKEKITRPLTQPQKIDGLLIKCNINKTIYIQNYNIMLNLRKKEDMEKFMTILECEYAQEETKYMEKLQEDLAKAKTKEEFDEINERIDKWQKKKLG